jgi:hypothetical protein
MKISVGMTLKITAIDRSKIIGSDWMNEREPCEGDQAVVEAVAGTAGENVLRLLCEPREGFLVWRVDIFESGVDFDEITPVNHSR